MGLDWLCFKYSSVLARIFTEGGTRCTVYLSMSLHCFSALCRVACKWSIYNRPTTVDAELSHTGMYH